MEIIEVLPVSDCCEDLSGLSISCNGLVKKSGQKRMPLIAGMASICQEIIGNNEISSSFMSAALELVK